MTIEVTIRGQDLSQLRMGTENYGYIIGNASNSDVTFGASNTTNTFETGIKESTYGGADVLNKLVANITSIFIDNYRTTVEKNEAVNKYNKIAPTAISNFDSIKQGSTIRKDVYKYREFVQFKRAKFKCTNVEEDPETGRIIRMTFESTGQFE